MFDRRIRDERIPNVFEYGWRAFCANMEFLGASMAAGSALIESFVRPLVPPSRAERAISHIEESPFGGHQVVNLKPRR